MSPNATLTQTLEPKFLERFHAQHIASARFAFFEEHDEWHLEDITVTYSDGKVIEEPYGDLLEHDLCALLEDSTPEQGDGQAGFFLVEVEKGTISKLDEAFVTELRWWQLAENVQRALENSGLV
jgi:hypothetical protein